MKITLKENIKPKLCVIINDVEGIASVYTGADVSILSQ